MNGTDLAFVRTAAGVFLSAVNDITNTGSDPGLISIMSSKGAGTTKGVTTVAVGNVVDTQRRRRNRLTENYGTAVAVNP